MLWVLIFHVQRFCPFRPFSLITKKVIITNEVSSTPREINNFFSEISKTTANKTIIQACVNGVLTLSCKAVKNTDTDYEVQWKIQFPGTNGWMEFFYCQHKSNIHCYVQIPTLPEGLTVLRNPDGNATLERSERNAVQDHAQIACQVHGISDHSLQSHHLYEVNFTTRCKCSLFVGFFVTLHFDLLV